MERRKYIAELVARTGVQVDENDPVFAVVLLNRLILEDQKSELETLVEQLSKTGKAINGEVVKQGTNPVGHEDPLAASCRGGRAESGHAAGTCRSIGIDPQGDTAGNRRSNGAGGPLDGGNQSLDLDGCACLWRDLRCSGWTGCFSALLSK